MADAGVVRRRRVGMLSSSEKITGAKNAQADVLLQRLLERFQAETRKTTAELHAQSECVSHELQALSLERQCSELEARRRLNPSADYSHEHGIIASMRKYLAMGSAAGVARSDGEGAAAYARLQQGHKIRRTARPDSRSPAVTQAQAAIRRRTVARAANEQRLKQRAASSQTATYGRISTLRPEKTTITNASKYLKRMQTATLDKGMDTTATGRMPAGRQGSAGQGRASHVSGRMVTSKAASSLHDGRSSEDLQNDGAAASLHEDGVTSEQGEDAYDHGGKGFYIKANFPKKASPLWPDNDRIIKGGGDHAPRDRALHVRPSGTTRATRPLTLATMKECWIQVQARVRAFCSNCEQVTRTCQEQEWEREMKFTVSSSRGKQGTQHEHDIISTMAAM